MPSVRERSKLVEAQEHKRLTRSLLPVDKAIMVHVRCSAQGGDFCIIEAQVEVHDEAPKAVPIQSRINRLASKPMELVQKIVKHCRGLVFESLFTRSNHNPWVNGWIMS